MLQYAALDTSQATVALGFGPDARHYTVAAQMLLALDLPRVQVLTNNPDKPAQLERLGIEVTRQVPTGVHVSPANAHYLSTKARFGAHTIDLGADVATELGLRRDRRRGTA